MPSLGQRLSAAFTGFRLGRPATRLAAPPLRQRSYSAANYDRLTEDWLAPLTTGDAEMRTRLRTLRGRARELERNEPYTIRYLAALENNVYDHHGITLKSRAGELSKDPKTGQPIFRFDESANRIIESAYEEWKKNPFVTRDMTLNEGGRLALRTTARDGDPLVKFVVDSRYPFGLALQLLEPDMIDDYRNTARASGTTQIRMGVEVDEVFSTVAYWLLKNHPGDMQWWSTEGYWSERHDAAGFLHLFRRRRITQVRDVSWLVGIMRDLKMLDGYDEAAITAARTGAAKMGFITRDPNAPGAGYVGENVDENGNPIDPALGGNMSMDAEPGLIEDLSQSPGLRFEKWDPAYPHDAYADFVKARLRRIGAGLNMGYNTLANDLENVNFSSIRAGLLDERENYKALQTWWIDHFERPIFLRWLEMALLTGQLKDPLNGAALPFAKLKKFSAHQFRPRRWPWVDPEKDINADVIAINNRLKSRSEVIEENGEQDFDDVIEQTAAEESRAAAAGVVLPAVAAAPGAPSTAPAAAGAAEGAADTAASDMESLRLKHETLRQRIETYGVAVRAGVITPNEADEIALRKELELPPINSDIRAAWTEDGRARKPVTLQGQKENAAQADAVAAQSGSAPESES